jgi:hypothetical protein
MFSPCNLLYRYIAGPLPSAVCRFNYFYKLTLTTEVMLFANCFLVARYVSIFCLKNPTALPHDFWSLFVNMWVVGFSWTVQGSI